jgi:gliding motility-associated-like protein
VRHTNGCIQATNTFDIEDYQPLSLVLVAGDEAGEIVADAQGGTGDYEFTLNGESFGDTNTFIASETGTYVVVVYESAGCEATAQIDIEILDPCIPEYFTPNGDGTSDGWTIECSDLYPNLTFDIFDRYGRKIATLRVGEYWDGTYNGTELPTGDYWYVVHPNSAALNKEYVGHFTLYR